MGIVAINLLWVSSRDQTGAFIYVKNLLDQIFRLDRKTKFILIVRWRDRSYFKNRYRQQPNTAVYTSDPRLDLWLRPRLAVKKLWAKWRRDEELMERLIAQELNALIRKKQIKKMFFPTQLIYPRGLSGIKQSVTVLDLQHEYLPDNFSAAEIAKRRDDLDYAAKTTDRLFAISEFTKKTLIDKLKLPADRITVTPLAPDDLTVTPAPINLPKPFLFYPAALWPHKNHRLAIEVLRHLSSAHPNLHLVFSGVIKKKSLKAELDELVAQYRLTDRVHFLGFVSDEIVAWLYQNAAILIFPSSFEGFGMPILEAYRHGLPVVAARNTSLTEVAGDAALLCTTNSIEEFAAAIDKLLKDDKVKASLQPKMVEQLKKFSWDVTARKIMASWRGY